MSITILFLVYGALCIGVGFFLRRDGNSSLYHTSGRQSGSLELAAGLFTVIGAGEYMTMTALAYFYGAGSLALFAGVATGFLALAFMAKHVRKRAAEEDMHSIPDFLGAQFGHAAALGATLYCILSLGCLLLIQFVAGGMMVQMLTGLPYSASVLLMAGIISAYIGLSGFPSVMLTDKIQAFFMIGTAFVFLIFFDQEAAVPLFLKDFTAPSLPAHAGVFLFVSGFFAIIGGGDIWQRLLAARDTRTMRHGTILGGSGILLFGIFIYWLALHVRADFPDTDPNTAFTVFLGSLPPEAASVIGLAVLSAILSTADTELFALSVILHRQALRRTGKPMNVCSTRRTVLAVAAVACLIALFLTQLVDIYMALLYLFTILGAVTLPALLKRGNSTTLLCGLAGGAAVLAVLLATGQIENGWLALLLLLPSLPDWLVRSPSYI